jgi:uncharacterized protein
MPRQENQNRKVKPHEPISDATGFDKLAPSRVEKAQSVFPVVAALLGFIVLLGCSRTPAPTTFSPDQIQAITTKAENGDAEAQRTLGQAYAKGEAVQQDYKQAAKWYEKAANQSNTLAQVALGELCEAGQGVPRDEAQASNWYRRAAEQGYANAQYNLAALYAVGKGVPLNNAEALKWYLQAANQGDPLAQYNVGMRYFEGHGVKPDQVAAYKWLSLSADQHIPDAARALATLKDRISSEDQAKARSLIREFKASSSAKR